MSLGVPLRWGTTHVKAGQNIFLSQTMTLYENDNTADEKWVLLLGSGSKQVLYR